MKLDDIKKLQQKKYRDKLGHFLVEGEHLILELFNAIAVQPELLQAKLYYTEEHQSWLQTHNKAGLPSTLINDKTMKQISATLSPQGIVAVVPLLANKQAKRCPKAIYLHEIQDPGNLGTIIRTLVWFGGFKLFLSAGSVDPFNPKVVRSSMGAIFHLPIVQNAVLPEVQAAYPRIAYLDMHGTAISDASFQEFDCYAFGNEARGVPAEQLKAVNGQAFTIPGSGQIESLNLGQTVGMSVFRLQN